jgi:hypothetical protein
MRESCGSAVDLFGYIADRWHRLRALGFISLGLCLPTVSAAEGPPTPTISIGQVAVTEGDSGTVSATLNVTLTSPLIDPWRITDWNPGILTDTQLNLPLGGDGLPVRTEICATPRPGEDLNTAIESCPEGRVIQLQAAKYSVNYTIVLNKGVVLRGTGSQGAGAGGTTIERTGGGAVVVVGAGTNPSPDQACYQSSFDSGYNLTEDAAKGSSILRVGANASRFRAGDFALVDQIDDASMTARSDCPYYKRSGNPARSTSQRVEIASVDTGSGSVTLKTPLHWTFRTASPYIAQIARVKGVMTRWAGIESVRLQGGTNPGYNGMTAGGIDITNAAYCWAKDVQTDGTIGGMHIAMRGAYRCVVRDSYIHHSANYGFGTDCYGIVVGCGSADNLIENNIARYMNKPIQLSNSGGGNVVGYNYADNAWATPPAFQEVPIDSHCSYPHMELVEGNFAPHIATPDTHGATGYITFFRNYASSQFAYPPVYGSTERQTGNVQAMSFCPACNYMTIVGNVLGPAAGSDPRSAVGISTSICTSDYGACIFAFGPNGVAESSYKTARIHRNFDTVSNAVVGNAGAPLPASLYLDQKPAWWPNGSPWPWTGPDLSPMVGTLPAKARSDALNP